LYSGGQLDDDSSVLDDDATPPRHVLESGKRLKQARLHGLNLKDVSRVFVPPFTLLPGRNANFMSIPMEVSRDLKFKLGNDRVFHCLFRS